MTLPTFRYHPDPIRSGSIVESEKKCRCCRQVRGYVYSGPAYCEEDLEDEICPWCIADGSAHRMFEAEFVGYEAFPDGTPQAAIDEIMQRTPGYSAWQSEHWPLCCGDASAFRGPTGIKEIRATEYQLEGLLMGHIVQEMKISGGAAHRLLDSLDKDRGPTAYVFQCLHCNRHLFHVDFP